MEKSTWTVPEFEEVNLGSEIGTYYEDEGEPSFVTRDPARARRASSVADRQTAGRALSPRGV